MPTPKLSTNVSLTNYLKYNRENETLALMNASFKPTDRLSMSVGAGCDINTVFDEEFKATVDPALQANINYKINDYISVQGRWRNLGGNNAERATITAGYEFDENQKVSAATFLNCSHKNGTSFNTGIYGTYTYTFDSGISLGAEYQQNFPLGSGQNMKDILADKSQRMINIMLNIPFKPKEH